MAEKNGTLAPPTTTNPATSHPSSAFSSSSPSLDNVQAEKTMSQTERERTHTNEALAAATDEKVATADAAAAPGVEDKAVDGNAHQEDDESRYPSGLKMATITVALSFAVLCVALDNTIIATAIPRITDDFKSLDDVGWYGSAYLLTTCAFQLLFGKFYSFFSIKWTFLVALGIFELGSLICGVAPNSVALIVGRAIAGLGSAGLFSGALIIVAYTVPLRKRPLYTGLISSMYGVASVIGPIMGGAFTDNVHATWRWCFYINLPFGGITAGILLFFFKSPAREKEGSIGFRARFDRFDPFGTIFFVPAIVCLLLALQWGGTTYPWSDGRVIALFVVFGVLIIAFVAVQIWKGDNATVPPRIASKRSISCAAYFGFCLGGSFFIFIYFLPIWFQAIIGTSPTQSGINILPLMLSQVVGAIGSGAAVTALGYFNPFMLASPVFMAIGAGLIQTFTVDIPTARWIGYQIIYGIGTGIGFQQPLIAAQTVLPLKDVPTGTAFVMFIQILGGALFVSVGQNVFSNELIKGLLALGIPGLNPALIAQAGATQLRNIIQDPTLQSSVIIAYNAALDKVFQVGLIMGCLAILGAVGMEWKSLKGKKTPEGGA